MKYRVLAFVLLVGGLGACVVPPPPPPPTTTTTLSTTTTTVSTTSTTAPPAPSCVLTHSETPVTFPDRIRVDWTLQSVSHWPNGTHQADVFWDDGSGTQQSLGIPLTDIPHSDTYYIPVTAYGTHAFEVKPPPPYDTADACAFQVTVTR